MAKPTFKLNRHFTAESVLLAFHGEGLTKKQREKLKLADSMMDGGRGTQKVGGNDQLKAITKAGFWGFTEFTKPPTIHYWSDGSSSMETLAFFFGHEIGHTVGKPLKGIAEEYRADVYGEVARQALSAVLDEQAIQGKFPGLASSAGSAKK